MQSAPCLLVWRLPSARALALLVAVGVMPYEFLKLPITALLAYLLFAEVPTVWTWLGGAVIFASTIYIGHREARLARTRAAAAAATEIVAPRASARA